jgi:uncharacterized protein (DUF4415 family)
MKKEYDFNKAKVHKGPIVKSNKVQKTFRLDEDVFDWLQLESKKTGIPYQTLTNSLLKKQMLDGNSLEIRISKIEQKIGMKKTG